MPGVLCQNEGAVVNLVTHQDQTAQPGLLQTSLC